jgi:hypothetical protein
MILEYNDIYDIHDLENSWYCIHTDLIIDLMEVYTYGD